jgi:hypothetical protein
MPVSSEEKERELLRLARDRFPNLSDAELKLLAAAPTGELAYCGPEDLAHAHNDPKHADAWANDREIRADLIRWLCTNADASERVDPRGIQVVGAKITGGLDLSFAHVPFPLALVRCRITEKINLQQLNLPVLSLEGSFTAALSAEGLNAVGSIFLNNGFSAEGEVRLLDAQIGGQLSCTKGSFKNPNGYALNADDLNAAGSVFLSDGFSAEGEVSLLGVQIGGQLVCTKGSFKNPNGDALSADGANVTGSVFLRDGFSAEGAVRLLGAQIGGQLACTKGSFKNPNGYALDADGLNVTGYVFLRDGFSAEGEVRFPGAQIGGQLDCTEGSFKNPNGLAVNAEGANIHDTFFWRGIVPSDDTSLNLIDAQVRTLADDQASWPARGKLVLDGFRYERIADGSPKDAESRLEWLRRQPSFTTQPYRQLARVLREEARVPAARTVLVEMERRIRQPANSTEASLPARISNLFLGRPWSWFLRWTIGYGHRPLLALGWLAALSLIGALVLLIAYNSGAMGPADPRAFDQYRYSGTVPDYYPPFNFLVYSIETSFPLINFGQRDHWAPLALSNEPTPAASRGLLAHIRAFVPASHAALRGWLYLQMMSGWILAAFFVAGLSGVVQTRE